ncbi:replicative DNA helicase [Paramagnetospirillum caucaseum]|uniref:DNA 5'-3' helicase n=1 Tax=Paramagnetospirillum caucaseum TaxID=1244869 RepID=M3AEW8_9PROT|nr:DnaB-like helicase C-terminal domain-containing protein [Paramagnetospirillum caucaseum]EME71403.1 replicative DNA helicase [Paramagnetospirillum caucaseum]
MTHQPPPDWSPADTAFRAPPHNYEAEQALLGAVMLRGPALDEVAEIVTAEHFADPAHGRIFAAMLALAERGAKPSPVTLQSYFERDVALAEIGGVRYLALLADCVVSTANVVDYARLVRDMADRRALIVACQGAVGEAYDPRVDLPARAIVEQLEAALTEMAADAALGVGPQPIGGSALAAVSRIDSIRRGDRKALGLPTGLAPLDRMIGGLKPGLLYVGAGRPSMGKSVLAENIARHVGGLPDGPDVPRGRVAMFALEMTGQDVSDRSLAAETGVPLSAILQGDPTDWQFEKLAVAAGEMGNLRLDIDDTPALTAQAIRARARRIKRKHGLRLVVVDHLHRMGRAGLNETAEITAITGALKDMAKELHVPVLLMAQLNRDLEKREDKRPMMSDLRQSGSIEQDADVVLLLYREQYYLERAEPAKRPDETQEKFNDRHARWSERCEEVMGTGDVIVAKQRQGKIGVVRLGFNGDFCKFFDLEAANAAR